MNLKQDLEVFLITYNRKPSLTSTLGQIFNDNSPIKNLDITILDNCSTDGTTELIKEFAGKYSNINHIRHNRNIGGNANIARAFELASKKYIWILCDDDSFDWTYWHEIEEGLEKDCDAVFAERKVAAMTTADIPLIINTLSFVPAAIYKTENITNDVMQNMMTNILYSMPHLALGCSLVNNKKSFYIPKHTIVSQIGGHAFSKGYVREIHPRQRDTNLMSSFVSSYLMIKDKALRHRCCEELILGKSFYQSMRYFVKSEPFSIYNYCDVFNTINFRQKLILLFATFLYVFRTKIFSVYKTDRGINIMLFTVKTKIIPWKKSTPKKILLTGSGGFVGRNLKAFLEKKGFTVTAPKSADYDFSDKVTVENLVKETRPDIFILSGFYGISDAGIPADITNKNLQIFHNFAEASGCNKTIITFGSGAEFDKSGPIQKAKESDLGTVVPRDLYGNAKYLLSQEIKKNKSALNLRLFGVYGPNELERRFITYAIKQNIAKEPITMRQNVVFDYLYIDDLCKIVLSFINKKPKEQFINITPTESIDLITISNIVNDIGGFNSEISATVPGLNNEYSGDNSVLLKELPGFKFTSYRKGIKKLYKFIKDN